MRRRLQILRDAIAYMLNCRTSTRLRPIYLHSYIPVNKTVSTGRALPCVRAHVAVTPVSLRHVVMYT